MSTSTPEAPQAPAQVVAGRVAVVSKSTVRGMEQGRVWVEVYLPFDPVAFASFCKLAAKMGTGNEGFKAAAVANPELASKALTPIDAHGEAMLAEDLQVLADSWLAESRAMDANHDNKARKSLQVVGSFINDDQVASPKFWPGAWVVVFKADPKSPEFKAIEKGQYNAVSFQASVIKRPVTVTLAPLAEAA